MRDRATYRIGLAMAAGAILAGCAQAAPSTSTSASPLPSAPAPTSAEATPAESRPSGLPTITKTEKPPKEPTDDLPSTGWVGGMVTRGGTGPCYGLIADDGMEYALYNTTGLELTKGARVKVHLETTLLRIYCGPGELMAMTDAEPIK